MICIYEANCSDFSGNGLGALTPLECSVTETLNGEWELTLVHDIDERGRWALLTEGCILRAPVPAASTPQIDMVTAASTETWIYKVNTSSSNLHLRSGTGTNYKILGKYKKGTEVIVVAKTTSTWYEVTCPDGKHGYMYASYLKYVKAATSAQDAKHEVVESRQLRDQPFRIYRVVPELDKVTVYARHIFYDLLDNMIQSLRPSPTAARAFVV